MHYLSQDPTTYLSHVLRGLEGYVRFLESFVESGAVLGQADRDYLQRVFASLCLVIDRLLSKPIGE